MVEKKITPEEKLLRIIEVPAAEKQNAPSSIKARVIGLKGLAVFLSKIFHIDKEAIKRANLQLVNKIVLALCIIFTVFWLFDFFRVFGNLRKKFDQLKKEEVVVVVPGENTPHLDINISEAIELSKKRNIFTFLPVTPGAQDGIPSDIAQIIAELKLVGIIWSRNPQVMIEDTKSQKTHFLSKGDQLDQIKVKEIYRDRAVLTKDTEEFELR